jgi:hypothetical protein
LGKQSGPFPAKMGATVALAPTQEWHEASHFHRMARSSSLLILAQMRSAAWL